MPRSLVALRTTTRPSGRPGPSEGPKRPLLRVVSGGRNRHALATLPLAALDELAMEYQAVRAERLEFVQGVRASVRQALVALSRPSPAVGVAGMALADLAAAIERESTRVLHRDAIDSLCEDVRRHPGHGRAS